MPSPRFTSETARLNGLKGVEARRLKRELALTLPKPPREAVSKPAQITPQEHNRDARKLTYAFRLKLDSLIHCDDAKECAALARCCRELRETYHLVTGEARPGLRKPGRDQRRTNPVLNPVPIPGPATPQAGIVVQTIPQVVVETKSQTTSQSEPKPSPEPEQLKP